MSNGERHDTRRETTSARGASTLAECRLVELTANYRSELRAFCRAVGADESSVPPPASARAGLAGTPDLVALWTLAAERVGIHEVGLRFAAFSDPRRLGLVWLLTSSGPTMWHGVDRLARHLPLLGAPSRLAMKWTARNWIVSVDEHVGIPQWVPQVIVGLMARGLADAAGVRPRYVTLRGSRHVDRSFAKALLGCPLTEGPYAIHYPRSAARATLRACDATPRELEANAELAAQLWVARDPTLRSVAETTLRTEVRDDPTLARLSRALDVLPRTIQRRLRRLGFTYRSLSDALRFLRAGHLLDDAARSIDSIAVALGYSDDRAFRRAFQRWTGMSPHQYRVRISG